DVHSQARGTVQIQGTIVDKTTLLGRPLRNLEGEVVDSVFRLAQSDETGAYEKAEDLAQAEGLNTKQIQFFRFIVDGGHQVSARVAEILSQLQSPGLRLREREHVLFESIEGEGSRAVEDGALQVFLQGDFAALERRDQHLMAAFEFDFIQIEVFESLLALLVVPCIAEQHAAYIPENRGDFGQGGPPTLRLVLSEYLTG